MPKTKKTKIKRTIMNNGSTTQTTKKTGGITNLIGLIILSVAIVTAVVIMVCCFSVNVEVTTTGAQDNTTQTRQEGYNSDVINNNDNAITISNTSTTTTTQTTTTTSIVTTEPKQEQEETPTPSGTGEVAPTEEEEQKPAPNEEPVNDEPSEEDTPKVDPREESETDPVEEELAPEPVMIINSTLKIKVIIDNIKGRPQTKYYELSSTEGNTIGYETILEFIDGQLLNDYGYYVMEKVDGPQASYTFTSGDVMYSTIFTVMVRR